MKKIININTLKIITILLALIFLFSLSPQKPKSSILGIPYGGPAVLFHPLLCSAPSGILLYIGAPKPINLMQTLNVTAYKLWGPYKMLGQQGLGKASSTPVPCRTPTPYGLVTTGYGFVPMIQGTSKGVGGPAVSNISNLAVIGAVVGAVASTGNSDNSTNGTTTSCAAKEPGHMLIYGLGNQVYHPETCEKISIVSDYDTCTVTGAHSGNSTSSSSIPVGKYTKTTDYFAGEGSCLSAKYSCQANDGKLNRNGFKTGSIKLKNGSCVTEQVQCIDGDNRKLSVQNQKDA